MAAGLPIVTALPGWVYGAASWFHERVMQPVLSGRPVLQVGKGNAWVSPIHFHDCARALVHLAECGEPEGRYFLVNNDPVQVHDFAKTCARVSARPLKVRRVPSLVARILIGSIGAECLDRDAVFSNIRLRGTGFQFRYHTLEQGIRHLLRTVHE